MAKIGANDGQVTWIKEDRNRYGRSAALARLDYLDGASGSHDSFIYLAGSIDKVSAATGLDWTMAWYGLIQKFKSDGLVKNMVELEFDDLGKEIV